MNDFLGLPVEKKSIVKIPQNPKHNDNNNIKTLML